MMSRASIGPLVDVVGLGAKNAPSILIPSLVVTLIKSTNTLNPLVCDVQVMVCRCISAFYCRWRNGEMQLWFKLV